jgi:hypothetical protein
MLLFVRNLHQMTNPLLMIIKMLWEMITVSRYFLFLISVNNY